MGYRAEKGKIEKKIRLIKIVMLCIVVTVLVGLCVFSAFYPPAVWKYYVKKPKVSKRANGEMRIHFLDVGQGDCSLIELPDGKVALIDGGDTTEYTAETILRYLNALNIKRIDYLIVTHPDRDHCGSLRAVVEQKTVLNAYLPATKPESEGATYAAFYQELLEEDCVFTYADRRVDMSGEGYVFTFLYPYGEDTENPNYYDGQSSVVWLDYMGTSTIFMGDETSETEEQLIHEDKAGLLDALGVDLDSTEIVKVGHHGSASSSSLDFLQYLHAGVAVVSCGENNPYGHPADKVLENIATAGARLYRTDKNGAVVISVKGTGGYEVKTAK